MIKKVLKILGLALLGLLLALMVAPFLLKKEIIAEVKKGIDKNLNATVDFNDVDISFIKSFPEVQLVLTDVSVIGIDTFTDVPLLKAEKLNLDFNILPFIKKDMPKSLKYIGVVDGDINILVLNDSLRNFLIAKKSADTTSFHMALDKYDIINTRFTYTDFTLPIKITSLGTDHTGTGNISSDVYDLLTQSTSDSLTVVYDGFTYLKNVKASFDAKINVDFPKQKYTLLDNKIKLNSLEGNGDGYVQFVNDDMKIAASFDTKTQSFQNIMSVLPYLQNYNTAKASGHASLKAKVEGLYNGIRGVYPAFDLLLKIDKGSAQYAGLPYPISNVNADVFIKSTRSDMKDLTINVKGLNAEVNKEKINGNFSISNSTVDPKIAGNINADIHLENWVKALPIANLETAKGAVKGSLSFDAKQSDIDKAQYNAIKFNGNFTGNSIVYKAKGSPQITIGSIDFGASPSQATLLIKDVKMGASDINLSGKIENPMAYFGGNRNVNGNINIQSNVLDLNEWIAKSSRENTASSTLMPSVADYKYSTVDATWNIGKMLYGNHTVSHLKGQGTFGFENIDVRSFKATLDDSEIDFTGKLANVYSYIFHNEVLVGDIKLHSNYFDANKYMVLSSDTKQEVDSVLFYVPERVNVSMATSIDKLLYTNMELKYLKGTTSVQDRTILFQGLTAETLGGRVAFDALYATKNRKPDFSVKLDLAKMEVVKAYEKFVSFKALAPLAKYMQGLFNTTLIMEGQLAKGMIPELSNITASGFLETINGLIRGLAPLGELAEKLGLPQLNPMEMKDTKNWFDIKNGTVEVKEFTKTVQGVEMRIAGTHKIKGAMDYDLYLKVPRKLLKKNVVTGTLDKGWVFVENEAKKRGVDIAQGDYIDIKVDLGGTLSSPTSKITVLGATGKSMDEEIKDEVKAQVALAKDSITRVVNKKKEELKDTIMTRAEQEVDKLKKQAEEKATQVVNEAKDKIKKEVESKVDTFLGKTVSDSLKQKAGDILKNKTGQDIEVIKDKVKEWNPFKKKKAS
jgi:hypothetical protein